MRLYFSSLLLFLFSIPLWGASERIHLFEDQKRAGKQIESISTITLPEWKEMDFLIHQFIKETFPEKVKKIGQTESKYTTDERANDLKQMIETLRGMYDAIEKIEDKRITLLTRGKCLTVLISNFIGLVERFNLLLRNRWYTGVEELGRKSVTHAMMLEVFQRSEKKELFDIWFQFTEYIFTLLKKYKKFELDKSVEIKYFAIPKSTFSVQNTSFSLGYLKTERGYIPFVINKEEAFQSESIPFLTGDGTKSYVVQAERGNLIEYSMLVFAEDVKDGKKVITVELTHGINSRTPLVKEHVGFLPRVGSLEKSLLMYKRFNNLGSWMGYFPLPLTSLQQKVFKLGALEVLKNKIRHSKGQELNQFCSFVHEGSSTFFGSQQRKALSFKESECEQIENDVVLIDLLEEGGESSVVKEEKLEIAPFVVESALEKIDVRIAELSSELESEIMAELKLSEKEIGDFKKKKVEEKKGKKKAGKKKKRETQKKDKITEEQVELLKQKAQAIIEVYKVESRVKMREWQAIFNDLTADVRDLCEEVGIVEDVSLVATTGSHSVLHGREGALTLVRPHGHARDNAFSPDVVNDTIEKYVSIQFLQHLDHVFFALSDQELS